MNTINIFRGLIIALLGCISFAFFSSSSIVSKSSLANTLKMSGSFYDITEKDEKGRDVKFDKFKGKVVYGVNVASRCGYTASGYELLSKLAAMKDQGMEVMMFPCNQFGAQEPGTEAEIASFCALRGVKDGNLFQKADVNGANTRPTYKFLKEKGVLPSSISWNFAGKFLVDREGNVMPTESDVMKQAMALLAKK